MKNCPRDFLALFRNEKSNFIVAYTWAIKYIFKPFRFMYLSWVYIQQNAQSQDCLFYKDKPLKVQPCLSLAAFFIFSRKQQFFTAIGGWTGFDHVFQTHSIQNGLVRSLHIGACPNVTAGHRQGLIEARQDLHWRRNRLWVASHARCQ